MNEDRIVIVKPNESYEVDGIHFSTVPAYNKEKLYHPKRENWVGYVITLDDTTYYIAGDTDALEELLTVKADVVFLPVGGTYTMDFEEAAELANQLACETVVPTHYGAIVGTKEDGNRFAKLVQGKNVEILIS